MPSAGDSLFRLAFELLPDPAMLWRRTAGHDFVLETFNRAADAATHHKLTGYLGVAAAEFFALNPEIPTFFAEAWRTSQPVRRELLYRMRSTGEESWQVGECTRVGDGHVLAVFRDRTLEHRATDSLRESEATLRGILRAAPLGIGCVDRTRTIIWSNQRLADMLGRPLDEMRGMPARELYPSEAEYLRVGAVKHPQIRSGGVGSVDTVWVRRDGSTLDVHLQSAMLDPGRFEAGLVFTALDLTERRQAEAQRVRLEASMQQAQKLESLGVLAGGIAHDFNNLLMGVLGNVNLALLKLDATAGVRGELERIESAALRATDLTRQMLAYSGRGAFVTEVLSLSSLVREMVKLIEVSIAKTARLELDLAADLPPVDGDAGQLRQVVMNLLTNASEAMEGRSGDIRVSTREQWCSAACLSECLLGEGRPEGRYVVIEVADRGCGMDEATRARMFDPFFSTKFQGRGLGLAAVQGIIQGHRGALLVESVVGRGTSFRVLLPASDKPLAVSRLVAPEPARPGGRGRVLVVDDEQGVRETVQRILDWAGFEVQVAVDGAHAVRLFETAPASFDVVLLDLTMPGLSGDEVLRALAAVRPGVPVILSSGYNEEDAVQRLTTPGLAGFIQKPYRAQALIAKLNEVLGQAV